MTKEAQRILEVFRTQGVRRGQFIRFTDFGDAIVWEAGFVRDAPVREALRFLCEQRYLLELGTGLELAERGENEIYGQQGMPKHGARVYRVGDKLLIKQTVLRGTPPEYVIDEHRERHVREDDDAGIAAALRDAVNGRL